MTTLTILTMVPQVVKPLGITSGRIPDSAINATSERGNYEARNIR